MHLVKSFACLSALLTMLFGAEAMSMTFNCSNPPARVWGEYHMILASTSDFSELQVDVFGLVEGSTEAQEEEPVTVVEGLVSKSNSAPKASSSQWKNATPFDLTTEELGPATIYLHTTEFKGEDGESIARLKIGGKDLRLVCRYWRN